MHQMEHTQEVALRILAQELQVGYGRMGIDARKSSVDRLETNFHNALERVAPQATREGEHALTELRVGLDRVKGAYFPVFASQAINGDVSRNLALAILRDGKEQNFWAPQIDNFAALVAVSGAKFDGPFTIENALKYLRNLGTQHLSSLQKTNSTNLTGACQFAGIELFNLVREKMTSTAAKTGKLVGSGSLA